MNIIAVPWFLLALVSPRPLRACSPEFPTALLSMGDAAVLDAPTADFIAELERMSLVNSRFRASPKSADDEGEVGDLSRALARNKIKGTERDRLVLSLQMFRSKLQAMIATNEAWQATASWVNDEQGSHPGEPVGDPPAFAPIIVPQDLPAEFIDYLQGALVWQNHSIKDKGAARLSWEKILERPAAERKYKSLWAAYMLGKYWTDKDNDKAAGYFQQVRALAGQGFADSIGLAASSLGWEARIYLRQGSCGRAIRLYLEQMATEDPTAGESLRIAAATALAQGNAALASYARQPQIQRVLTAYIIAEGKRSQTEETGTEANDSARARWLAAVETAEVKDVDSAEKLALAAYRNNQMEIADRWVKRSPHSLLSRWIKSKLLLRDGKVDQGIALLSQVVRDMPVETNPGTNSTTSSLSDNLRFPDSYRADISVPRHALAELGVLQLSRHEYIQALDALLNSGFWVDAAYVAERVLTLDELKPYVESHWPVVAEPESTNSTEISLSGEDPRSAGQTRQAIRYLLARRLTRNLRGDEARPFYPPGMLPAYDSLVQNLREGWDESLPANQRAAALFHAAQLTRNQGMELLGTELQPDASICGGSFDADNYLTWEERARNQVAKIVPARGEELRRVKSHAADPEVRFHYRFQAAALAWEAAKLMPNNSDETAYVLWAGGNYIKTRDPQTADIFYKSLVRRNRKTALGAEADRIRWFPSLDEQGNIIVNEPPPAGDPLPTEDTNNDAVGQEPVSVEETTAVEPQR